MSKIVIISPKNELSGSCVSINNLKELLIENKFSVSIITTEGNYFSNSYNILFNTEFNILKIFLNILKLNFFLRKFKGNCFFLFNSILSFPYLFLSYKKNKAILIHELDLNPKWLYKLIIYLINFFNLKVCVVNPYMLKIYKNSYLLPNYYKNNLRIRNRIKKKEKQILKIANCFIKKGIEDFIILSKKYPEFEFILLTQKKASQKECLELLKNTPPNLEVEYNQNKKEELLFSSKYLISLSKANETFGLVLLEAIAHGTIPISVENPGSNYCLNKDKDLIYERNFLINNFEEIINNLNKNYDYIMNKLKKYITIEFSKRHILENFLKLINA